MPQETENLHQPSSICLDIPEGVDAKAFAERLRKFLKDDGQYVQIHWGPYNYDPRYGSPVFYIP